MPASQIGIALGIVALIYTLGLIVGLAYVAANKPDNREATRYTILGLGLFIASNLSGILLRPVVVVASQWFGYSFILTSFFQMVLAALAVFSLVKAVYVASRDKQDPGPQPAPNPLDHQPPFRPLDQGS